MNVMTVIQRGLFVGLVVSSALMLTACDKPKPPQMPAAKVTVAKPVQQTVQSYQTFDGTASPYLYVNLEARVPGYLEQILFKDGAQVKKGDLLFVIEQDQYQQQVLLNQAIYDEAKIEFDRQSTLLIQKATSQASVDQARSKLQQAQANLSLAKINLGYTEVRAPFDGVMGRHLIDVGNYLGTSPDGIKLAEIRQVSPLYVYFSMNEMELLSYLRMRRQTGQPTGSLVGKLPVYVGLQGESNFPHQGVLDFAASELNVLTGSLQLRGLFDNADGSIVPGVYAKVLVNYGDKRESLLVPAEVILRDQQGTYVFLVGQDKKVERRNIQTGQSFGRLVEVSHGLKPDDMVVINGFVTLSVGQTVDPETGTIAPAQLPGAGTAPVANQPKG
jgi:multidrug efflux system membrane fusion protein